MVWPESAREGPALWTSADTSCTLITSDCQHNNLTGKYVGNKTTSAGQAGATNKELIKSFDRNKQVKNVSKERVTHIQMCEVSGHGEVSPLS